MIAPGSKKKNQVGKNNVTKNYLANGIEIYDNRRRKLPVFFPSVCGLKFGFAE